MKVKPKKYIVWSVDRSLDLSNPWIKKWFIKQVLTKGRAEDVAQQSINHGASRGASALSA
jgi:hypothetical protein